MDDFDKVDDMTFYRRWSDNPNKENFQTLYHAFGGLLNTASQKASYGSTLPRSAFKLQAAQEFHNALGNYNPNYGVKLGTYLYKSVHEKLKRLNYKYSQIARIPERSGAALGAFHVNKYMNAKAILHERLNRAPTDLEIANELNKTELVKITPEKVKQLGEELHKDLSLSSELETMTAFDDEAALKATLSMFYYDMSQEEKDLYDYTWGAHGKTAIVKSNGAPDFTRIARQMAVSETKLSKIRKTLVDRISNKVGM